MENLEKIMEPYFEKRNQIEKEKSDSVAKLNSLKMRLERLLDNKEREIQEYVTAEVNSSYNFYPGYGDRIRRDLELAYAEKENELRKEIESFETTNKFHRVDLREMVEIKDELRIKLFAERKKLNYELREQKINYDMNLLRLDNFKYEYNEQGQVINGEAFREIYNNGNAISDRIREIESNLEKLEEYLKLTELTQEEISAVMRSMTDWEKEEYDRRKAAYFEEPAPVVEEPTPVVEEPTPVVEEPTPVVEEPAPVVEEPAPVVEEPAPVVEESTPVVEEPVPVVKEPSKTIDEDSEIVVIPVEEEDELSDSFKEAYKNAMAKKAADKQSNLAETETELIDVPTDEDDIDLEIDRLSKEDVVSIDDDVTSEYEETDEGIVVQDIDNLLKTVYLDIVDNAKLMASIKFNPSKSNENGMYISSREKGDEYTLNGTVEVQNEEDVQLPCGEYLNYQDIRYALDNLYKKTKGKTYVVEETGKEYIISKSTIRKLKRSLKKCSRVKLIKEKKLSRFDLFKKLGKKKSDEVIKEIEISELYNPKVPLGEYINRNEFIASLDELFTTRKIEWLRNLSDKLKRKKDVIEDEDDYTFEEVELSEIAEDYNKGLKR